MFFDENGVECARYDLNPREGRFGFQIPKGQWHTVLVDEHCVMFEAKDGAYMSLAPEDLLNYE